MKVEHWQNVDGQLVVDKNNAIIVKDSELLKSPEALETEMKKTVSQLIKSERI